MTTLTTDKEEALLRGYIPLAKDILETLNRGEQIEKIIFSGNGYVTDAVLQLIKRKCKSKNVFDNLTLVNLVGSDFITDYGVRCLLETVGNRNKLQQVDLSGCSKVSDSSFALLYALNVKNDCKASLKGTSVTCLTGTSTAIETQGCPCLQSCGSTKQHLHGQVLIASPSGMKNSVARYLQDGSVSDATHGCHLTDTTAGKWTMAVTELATSSNLFDHMTSSNLTQVIIPFEADATPQDIKRHVMSSIAKVVAKEQVLCKFPELKLFHTGVVSKRPWLDIQTIDRLKMIDSPDGGKLLSNVSITEESIGVFVSREPLTRSNSYFEVKLPPSKVKKLAVLMGCLYDHLFSERHPMDSSSDIGGYVDGFEATNEASVIGFGIDGQWLSEYVPSKDAKFFFSQDGVKKEGKIGENDMPCNGMYPLISILGEEVGQAKLPPLVSPPQELTEKWKKEKRWIEKGVSFNTMVDNYGNLRYLSNYENAGPGYFLGMNEMSLGKDNDSFTVELVKLSACHGGSTEISMGVAGETYRPNKMKDAGVIQLSLKSYAYFQPWSCGECNVENEGTIKTCVSCKNGKRPPEAVNPTTWTCTECQFPNEKHVEQCTKCKKGTMPQGFGKMRQEVFTQINSEIETKVIENLSFGEGDTFSVTVSNLGDTSPENVTKVVFYHNDKQIIKRNFVFNPVKKCRLVPFIQMTKPEDHLRLKNFRPTYRRPAPFKDKITVGRANHLAVYDNGSVEYKTRNPTSRTYGFFMAKTPFNKDMLEFTVEATSLGSTQLFGIGICSDADYPVNSFVGWKQGSVGYHADNGGLYDNYSIASTENVAKKAGDIKFTSGSVVSVRVLPKDEDTPIKFDDNGFVDSQQVVTLQFTKNGVVVYQLSHEILGHSIYPVFSLKTGSVKIQNFYAETGALWDDIETKENEAKQIASLTSKPKSLKSENEVAPYCGTEFLVVGVSSGGGSDVSGKLQIVQQQIDLNDWEELKNVTAAIAHMEKNLEDLGLQDQRKYGQLCAIEDNMKLLVSNPGRITYHTADMAKPDFRQDLLAKIEAIQDRHRTLQSVRYNTSEPFLKVQQEVMKELERSKVIKVNDLLSATGGQDSRAKKAEDYGWMKDCPDIDGNTLLAHLRDLQDKGKLVLLELGSGLVAANIGFLLEVEGRMGHLLPTAMMNMSTMLRCIGQTSHVWSNDVFDKKILTGGLSAGKVEDIKMVLEAAFGLIQLPCLRTSPDDEKYIYITQQNVTNPPVSMGEFWTPQMDNTDFIVMKQTYSFPLSTTDNFVSLVISNTAKYGRIVILTGEGVVYHNGAVQTVIVATQDSSGKDSLLIESRCYIPDAVLKEECGMTKQTVSYVQDYTWNVFSTYTDIVDDLLQRRQTVGLVTKFWTQDMVNVSIGCKHCWVSSSSDSVRQTVCTLCNTCCDKGSNCTWNGIMGDNLRQCGCGTEVDGCNDCGICLRCAEELWALRSRLRPFSTVMTEVLQSTEEKLAMKKKKGEKSEEPGESPALRDPVKQPSFPLDPFCYNEVTFTNLSTDGKILCLREESDGTLLQAYPGKAKMIDDSTNVNYKEVFSQDIYKLSVGDQVKLKISDPLGTCSKAVLEEDSKEEAIVIESQYFSLQAREVKVMQETGIIMYDTTSPSIPVAQFIGCKPMTNENNNFSIRILSKGKRNTISIGLVPANYAPNRQPGWNSQSIGYHADDGGIFLESGSATRRTKPASEGDIMSLYIDFDKNKGWFRKNGEKCIELNLNFSRLGLYPCVGFHSVGEAVQLLEKDLWTPLTEEDRQRAQPSQPTYKYGNLWISPGKKMPLMKVGKEYCGWLVLHNPQKDPVGFKVRSGSKEFDNFFGVLQHKKDWIKNFTLKTDIPDAVTVEWSSLESGRDYTEDDMKKMFGVGEDYVHQSGHQHRLQVVVRESANVVEELPKVSSGAPKEQSLCLHVYRNLQLVDEYWLKVGSYQVVVECNTKQPSFVLKYPKCPAFNYGKNFQKGMKIIAFLESSKVYAESIVVDVYSGGRMLALEYSPKDKTTNMTICVMAKSPALVFTEFSEEDGTIWRYEARNTPSNLTRTFYSAPPYLLSEGAIKVFNFINKEWKSNVLKIFSYCYQVFTRLTVQEKHICSASRTPLEWMKNGASRYLYTLLPSRLSDTSNLYPTSDVLFKDISVHRMCFSAEELITQAGLEEKVAWRIPLHFVDIPGIVPSMPLPPEATFGDGLIVWTYISLISNRLHLPSYKNMIKGDIANLPRAHVEQQLYSILQVYSALCSIYSATWGGVEFSQINEQQQIKEAIRHDTTHIVKFSGKPPTETDMLFRKSGFATCKAHCMAMGVSDETFPDGVEFDYNYFEPYSDLISMFHWSYSKLSGLPEDFFEKFRYLQYFRLGDPQKTMHRFEKLPEGMSKCKLLKVVEMTETGMTELPSDFFLSQSAVSMYCTDMPIKTLPGQWPETSQVLELVLSGLLLTEVPPKLSSLENLERLELCYNPITDLPESLAQLKKLKVLYLTGSMWLTLEGKKTQITHEQYETWHMQNPAVRSYFGRKKMEELFKEFDFNNNGSLDEEELAALNLKLFFGMPRIGLADINDEVTGGIPQVVFSMAALNELYMDYCAVTVVPQAINNLQNLKTLSLNHNPLLMSLPGSLGHLPNMNSIHIQSCPAIRTPPTEVVSRGFESVKAYLKRLAGGYTECRRTKLMVVGLGGAGKTSLLRALMSANKTTLGTEAEIPTDGIDIVPWTVASEDGQEVTYSTWDFAGQAVYYNTHQFFLSKRAVYLLLWSMRQGFEHAGLDFWLSSICCHAPGTPILVVGTQCDLIPKAEIPEKELREQYPQIAGFFQVSSIKGTGILDLQKNLLDVTLQQGYMGEKIPQVWLNFEKRILAERLTKKNYLQWSVARRYAMEQGIYDEKDVRLAIQLLHDLGTVQYFDNDFLRDYVVINPQWIVNVMACVVSAQDSPIQKHKGRFLHKDIPTVWKDYDADLHSWLLRLTEDFDLTFPLPKEAINIVPCLLPSEPPDDLHWPKVRGQQGIRETKMVYRFTYLPSGLFNRAQVRLFQFSDGKMIWKKGSMLSKNKHLALIKQTDSKELVVFVQGPRPENIVFLIHEVFESIIEESFNGVHYEMFLPCPDCVLKEGTSDPDLLNAKLIQRAKDMKAPFLQCYKYFHWISMAQLQEKLPADSHGVSDFDMQLQQSIVALQELNNDLMMDTAIIYSSKDVPLLGDPHKIPPSLVRDDIISWGYSCWFAEDMDTVSYVDMTAAIKNCKVLIALVSDDFESDTKCCDMFLHAKETMNKDIIVVVIGESLTWQNKDLGIKIGKHERVLMAKNLTRYTNEGGRRDELKNWLGEKIAAQARVENTNPDVFVSYCWANSKDAQDRSGKVHPTGLGWGDPRALKAELEKDNTSCWLDIEQVGREKQGIFADMAAGIRNSKVILACISDEYAESDNCMMELRFGILNMNLPLVVAIVGSGSSWKETEVAMLVKRARAPEVILQMENPGGVAALVKYVKNAIVDSVLIGKKKKKKEEKDEQTSEQTTKEDKKAKEQTSSIAYKEEYELVQRRFMRHILGSISTVDTLPLPRLMVVDFVKSVTAVGETDGRESKEGQSSMSKSSIFSKRKLRPRSGRKSRDRLQIDESVFDEENTEDWSTESFCVKLLCENEEGWHLCSPMLPMAFRTRDHLETFLKKSAPYLYRIYSLLSQSPIKLKCFTPGKGHAFQDWIRGESELNADFVGAMQHLRSELLKDEASDFMGCLARCRLPSGKILWLCEHHQKQQHVAKLSTSSSGGSYALQKVLFNEDKLFLENLEKSEEYKALKSKQSTKVAPVLPQPVPIPIFIPVAPPPSGDEKKPQDDRKTEKKEEKDVKSEDKEVDDKSTKNDENSKTSTEQRQPRSNAKTELRRERSRSRERIPRRRRSPRIESDDGENEADGSSMPKPPSTRDDATATDKKGQSSDRSDGDKEALESKNGSEENGSSNELTKNEGNVNSNAGENEDNSSFDKEAIKRSIKQDVINSTKRKTLVGEGTRTSSIGKLNTLIQSSVKPNGSINPKFDSGGKSDQLQHMGSSQNLGRLQRGSTVKRLSSRKIFSQETVAQSKMSHRSVPGNVSDDLKMALKINTVGDSSESSISNSSAKSEKCGHSKSVLSRGTSEKSPLEKVRPRKITVTPKSEGNSPPRKDSKTNFKATGISIGSVKSPNMALPEQNGSRACVLQ